MKNPRKKNSQKIDRPRGLPSPTALKSFRDFVALADETFKQRDKKWKETGVLDRKPSLRSIAAKMGVSHGTILNYLSSLEAFLGRPLMDTGTLQLTNDGKVMLTYAEQVIGVYEKLTRDIYDVLGPYVEKDYTPLTDEEVKEITWRLEQQREDRKQSKGSKPPKD